MALDIQQQQQGDVRLFKLAGQLDPRSLHELETTLLQGLNDGHRSLLLDLSRLETIDGAGLRVLVTVGERLEAEGGRLVLCAPPPDLERVFEIAGLSRRLAILPSRAAALRWLEKSVRIARIARIAGSLLRRTAPGPAQRYAHAGPDMARFELATRLLGLNGSTVNVRDHERS